MCINKSGVSHTGVSHTGVSHTEVSHEGVSHEGVSHSGVSHTGVSHSGVSHTGVSHSGTCCRHISSTSHLSVFDGSEFIDLINVTKQYVCVYRCRYVYVCVCMCVCSKHIDIHAQCTHVSHMHAIHTDEKLYAIHCIVK